MIAELLPHKTKPKCKTLGLTVEQSLDILDYDVGMKKSYACDMRGAIETIRKELADNEINKKKLKAFKIIKKKYVIPAYIINSQNAEKYNRDLRKTTFKKDYEERKLTEEEFNLLKEALK